MRAVAWLMTVLSSTEMTFAHWFVAGRSAAGTLASRDIIVVLLVQVPKFPKLRTTIFPVLAHFTVAVGVVVHPVERVAV